MAHTVPSLWPKDIPIKVLTPAMVMRSQAAGLSELTSGQLLAEVRSVREPDSSNDDSSHERWAHRFEVVAPALNNYRHQLFLAVHPVELAYPVIVESQYLPVTDPFSVPSAVAFDQSEFINQVAIILRSNGTRAVIESLLARINEQSESES